MTNTYSPERIYSYFEKNKYVVLSEYIDAKSKMCFSDRDGYKYSLSYNAFRFGIEKGCEPSKFHKSNIFTIENIGNWLKINGKQISLFENNVFINAAKNNIIFICNKCFRQFKTSWNCVQEGKNCPSCQIILGGLKRRLSLEKVKEVFEKLDVSPIDVSKYDGHSNYMGVRCNFCDYEWEMTFTNAKKGNSCPKCKISKGEREVSRLLKKYEIPYEMQKTFEDCLYKRKLKFDFFIESKKIIIEYNGVQHYKLVHFSLSEEKNIKEFKETKIRDKIKKSFCKKNGIKLITISYKNFKEIESIIQTIKNGGFKKYE